jgi:hypothetical protein
LVCLGVGGKRLCGRGLNEERKGGRRRLPKVGSPLTRKVLKWG